MLGVGAGLTSASGPATALGLSPPTHAEIRIPPACLGGLGEDRPKPKESPSCEHPGSPGSCQFRTLSPSPGRPWQSAVGDARSGAHTLTPRFVYPGCDSRCLAKPHRHLVPADVNQPSPPAKPLTAEPHPSALLTSSHLMKRSPWLR